LGDRGAPHGADRVDVRDASAAWIEHFDLADELARAERERAAGPLDAHRAGHQEKELGPSLAGAHDHLPIAVLTCLAARENRIQELLRQRREDVRILDQSLVAPTVEEQRATVAVARELDLAEEERVVTSPVRANDASDEVRERALDEGRLVRDLERGLGQRVIGAAREPIGEAGLTGLEDTHSEARALVQECAHPSP